MLKKFCLLGALFFSTSAMADDVTVQLHCNELINNPRLNEGKPFDIILDENQGQVRIGDKTYKADFKALNNQAVTWKTDQQDGLVSLSRVDLSYSQYGSRPLKNGLKASEHQSTGCAITRVTGENAF